MLHKIILQHIYLQSKYVINKRKLSLKEYLKNSLTLNIKKNPIKCGYEKKTSPKTSIAFIQLISNCLRIYTHILILSYIHVNKKLEHVVSYCMYIEQLY